MKDKLKQAFDLIESAKYDNVVHAMKILRKLIDAPEPPQRELADLREENEHLTEQLADANASCAIAEESEHQLRKENENLKAYAKHERSLGAEPFAIEAQGLRQQLEDVTAERDQLKQDLSAELQGHLQIREILGARDGETMFAFAERFAKERDALTQKLEDCAIRNAMLAPFGRRVDELLKERDALKAALEQQK